MEQLPSISESSERKLNVLDEYQGLPLEAVQDIQKKESLPFSVCCLSINGDMNIGMIQRTSCLLGAERFLILGRRSYDKRATVGAHHYIPIDRIDALNRVDVSIDPEVFEKTMRDLKLIPVFVEQGGTPVDDVAWKVLDSQIKDCSCTPCFVFGNEQKGIGDNILKLKDTFEHSIVVTIPQRGVLRSFNVAAAASIVLWDFCKSVYLSRTW